MSRYSVLVTSSPYDNDGASRALAFCHQLLADGQEIEQIFFYQAGIYNAIPQMNPPNDEVNVYQAWCDLKLKARTSLRVCMTAGDKRGVTGTGEDKAFEHTGLSDFFTSLHQCEHLVQF